jgi:DNA-directed RNA polymerase subunit RPC12/RpoP
MDEFWAALASGAALALLGEAVKAGVDKWFRLFQRYRAERCPRCGRENLDRGLSGAAMAWFMLMILVFSLAFTGMVLLSVALVLMVVAMFAGFGDAGTTLWIAVLLATTTLTARFMVGPVTAYRTRPPIGCLDCGYRWPALR